jgi:hypothetical protein
MACQIQVPKNKPANISESKAGVDGDHNHAEPFLVGNGANSF